MPHFRKQLLEQIGHWHRSQEKARSLTGELAEPSSVRASALAQIEDARRAREQMRAIGFVFLEEIETQEELR